MNNHDKLMNNNKEYELEYIRLLFLHGEHFLQVHRALHLRQNDGFYVPQKHTGMVREIVEFWNKWHGKPKGGKNGKTK
jgi:hypothetical protein